MQTSETDTSTPLPRIVEIDPWLRPYAGALVRRARLREMREEHLTEGKIAIEDFASGHEYFGLHREGEEWVLRERAPNATKITLVGDCNGWRPSARYEFARISADTWELRLPRTELVHQQFYMMLVSWRENSSVHAAERVPAFCRRVVQDETTKLFSAQVWDPAEQYQWRHPHFRVPKRAPLIYEAHAGMALEEPRVGTYREFADLILPRIADGGYNTVQLMAVQEHPYYGSFGYQVSNFFAPSSRFGTPEDLMYLVDTAHGMGLAIIMDLVHSHAVKNEREGLSRIDGSYNLYFHDGQRGEHPAWNTRLFDYGKIDTLHLLLSNCRYWLDTFKFDGFRFDGVTSMIYRDHGLGYGISSYNDYFSENIDEDAVAYLGLANKVIHSLRDDAITIAEEVTGVPGLAAPLEDCGTGFDYRLAMGIPDYWIKLLKHSRDEDWNVSTLWWELTNRRADEKTIGYAESHDQALVGDKTLIFWLADKEMYWHMQVGDQNLVIDRAIALHKMIRLITLATGGNGYLNFIGNEFGHPEWVDFPRQGNDWSYHYARRQWSLRDNQQLKYRFLADFDRAMMRLTEEIRLFDDPWPYKHYEHVDDKILVFERAGLLFVFNFHPTESYTDRVIHVRPGTYRVVLDSDAPEFGGFNRINREMEYATSEVSGALRLYIPSRTVCVLRS